ncbi:hypothetical protein VCHA54O482_20267 [Vibrio chagasii]|nr:hypothetical protein VCHA36O163_20268 [Vibrio chagasii]CAH6889654.1 hypothetical protein VCHA31O71_20361 [Vibrio chagasii]CAH6906534.1 hypothetical protein VCHA34O109_20265 [Vibrio chagasii]CAH6974284.1 hypothetical protein VCHA35P150_40017 [Vibrio chagasii]CAH7276683.1 hypothetical protein VCHA49P382_20361 [Vibrio chagasii]
MEYLLVLLHVALIWMLAVATPGANVLLTINTALHYNRKLAKYSALVSVRPYCYGHCLDALAWLFCSPISRHCLAL